MTKYLAGVLSVIAAGILLIAYGLLAPQAQAAFATSEPGIVAASSARNPMARPVAFVQPAAQTIDDEISAPARPAVRSSSRSSTRTESAPRRDWKKTAMIIGGSSAAGAGVGGLIGGKKGALIGAAIGGGAGTIYETTKR